MSKRKFSKSTEKKDFLESLFKHKYEHLVFIALIFAIVSILFFRLGYLGYSPKASDTIQWRGAAQVLIEYNEENRDQALWNTNLFSGMPAFLISYPNRYPFIKNIFNFVFEYLINWSVVFMFFGGLGMYILMLSLGFKPMTAFIAGMAFTLSCHFIGLIEIGHNTKYRAIIYIPYIMFSVNYLFQHRNILGVGLTSMFLIQQLRENHVQISYYTFIMILVYWFFNLYWHRYEIKDYLVTTLLFLGALLITGMAVSHPYLSVWEYGNYTIRGGGGLTTEYATSWSFHPLEILTFIIPDFFGGISPYYWGWMPFTQTSMYMGIVIFALAIIAIVYWKDKIVKILTVVTAVSLLLSFGKHLPWLTNFLLSYLPFYNKFRVPAMILVLVQFSFVVMACYGLRIILKKVKEQDPDFKRLMLKFFIGCLAILILFIIFSEIGTWRGLPLEHRNDALRYEFRQLEMLREIRAEMLEKSSITSFAFLALFFLLTYLLALRKGVTPYLYLLLIAGITIVDLSIINSRHFDNLVPQEEVHQDFVKQDADRFLLEDEELFRIFPLREQFDHSRWAYYHQTIGGYHGAKLRRYQDIIDNSLHAELRYRVPINWNVARMLNVKYFITPVQLPFDELERSFYDRSMRLTIYEYKETLPRAWFVEDVEVIPDKQSVFRRLNSPAFDPAVTAITEKPLTDIAAPEESSIDITEYSLNNIEMQVSTDTESFLVLSEIYYPAGWHAYLNGEEIAIHPTNHILRGMVIPPGEHSLVLEFKPLGHRLGSILSLIGIILSIGLSGIGGYQYFKKHYSGGIDYVIKS